MRKERGKKCLRRGERGYEDGRGRDCVEGRAGRGGGVPGEGRKFPERVKSPRRRKTDCSEGNSSPRWKRGYVGGRERPRRGKKVYEAGRKSEEREEGLRRRGGKKVRGEGRKGL